MQKDNDAKIETLDLWTNVEENGQNASGIVAEQERSNIGRNTRHLSERAVLSLLRDWLLHDYVAQYCRSLAVTRIFRRCYWIDALGIDAKAQVLNAENGAHAKIVGDKKRKKGPPQATPAALKPLVTLSQALMQENKPISLYALLLEAGNSRRKEGHIAQGSNATQPFSMPKESGIITASWLEVAPHLLTETEQSPAIFLLNPFGHTLFNYEDLTPLYQRGVPTELCLLIPHKQVGLRLKAAQHKPEQASALTALLRTDRWKTLPAEQPEQSIIGCCELLMAALQRHFQLPLQLIDFPVSTSPASIEFIPYSLLFATRRQDSLVCMNDAICLYRRRVEMQSYQGVLSENWFVEQQSVRLEQAWQQLYQSILQMGATQRIRRWPDLRQQALLKQFGQFTQADYDKVIQQLLKDGKLRCAWRQDGGSEHTPANEDTLLWN